jgi:hypothetical protein
MFPPATSIRQAGLPRNGADRCENTELQILLPAVVMRGHPVEGLM